MYETSAKFPAVETVIALLPLYASGTVAACQILNICTGYQVEVAGDGVL